MGGCCGGQSPDNSIWTVTFGDGSTQDFIGKVNAETAIIKAGGGTKRCKSGC